MSRRSAGLRPGAKAKPDRSLRLVRVLRPQQYEDRVERALEALACGLRAAGALTEFLLAQQSPEWRDFAPLAVAAADLRAALRWLRPVSVRPRSPSRGPSLRRSPRSRR